MVQMQKASDMGMVCRFRERVLRVNNHGHASRISKWQVNSVNASGQVLIGARRAKVGCAYPEDPLTDYRRAAPGSDEAVLEHSSIASAEDGRDPW